MAESTGPAPLQATPATPEDMPEVNQDARTWGMLTHLAGLAGFLQPILFLVGPLIVWLVKRDSHPFIDANGKAAVNFQITMFLVVVILFVIFLPLFFAGAMGGYMMWSTNPFSFAGLPFFASFGMIIAGAMVMLIELIAVLVASVRASDGAVFQYPLAIPFLK